MWQTDLIILYCAVRNNSSTIEAVMQRQSNNFRPQFSDEECITVYLWGISQRRFKQKTIYNYIKNHLLDQFPKLPNYQAFSNRLNCLTPAFQALAGSWLGTIGVVARETGIDRILRGSRNKPDIQRIFLRYCGSDQHNAAGKLGDFVVVGDHHQRLMEFVAGDFQKPAEIQKFMFWWMLTKNGTI